jgi:membrane associated rhomboid family serine protease
MGIADRHYIRQQPPPPSGAGSGLRMLSVNTWIIIICAAVYMIDGMFPPLLVPGEAVRLVEGLTELPETATPLFEGPVRRDIHPQGYPTVPLLDRPGGTPIGWVEVFPMQPIAAYLHFSTRRGFMEVEFWRLIGFQFLHAHFPHLLLNMVALFFFGPLIERHLGSKRYLAFYLLCGIFGALMYTLLNLGGVIASLYLGSDVRIPGLLFNSTYVPLIGASAGVFGVLMAGAYLAPRATVLLFFIIPMKLRTLAYALVGLALFSIIFDRPNAGGEAGHLGGALAGWYFIRNQHHLHGFFDFLGWADPTSHHYRGKKGKPRQSTQSRAEVDRILDKISQEGMHSLTDKEKRTLREASREGR